MLNQLVMVGRLVKKPIIEKEDEKEKCTITLAVQRSYKNEEGAYETDFIDCVLLGGIASNTAEWCNKGDLIGIKGRIQSTITSDDNNTIDNNQKRQLEIIAEKVTFLSSKPKDEESEEN